MMNKIIDAALLNPPYYKHAVACGMKILANMTEMDIPIQHIGLVTSQKFLSANPDVNRRIVKSFLEGIHLMRTNPELSKKALSKYMRNIDPAELEESYQLLKSGSRSNPIRRWKASKPSSPSSPKKSPPHGPRIPRISSTRAFSNRLTARDSSTASTNKRDEG